jgi:hypothetical protein
MGMLPKKIENWSLTSLRQRLVRTGSCLIKHARYYWLDAGREPSHATTVRELGFASGVRAPSCRVGIRLQAMRLAGPKDGALAYIE